MSKATRLARAQFAALMADVENLKDDLARLHEVVDHILIGLENEEQEERTIVIEKGDA